MAAMLTKFVWLYVLFLLSTCSFVMCTLPFLPDNAVTGALKPFFLSQSFCKGRVNQAVICHLFILYELSWKQFDYCH